jgi:hypothetical protein
MPRGLIMGAIRKFLTTGLGAALATEEGIRSALSESQLTKQAREYLTRQAIKGKDEVSKVLRNEIKKFLNDINLHEELRKALAGLTLEIQASIHLKSADGSRHHDKASIRRLKIQKS